MIIMVLFIFVDAVIYIAVNILWKQNNFANFDFSTWCFATRKWSVQETACREQLIDMSDLVDVEMSYKKKHNRTLSVKEVMMKQTICAIYDHW